MGNLLQVHAATVAAAVCALALSACSSSDRGTGESPSPAAASSELTPSGDASTPEPQEPFPFDAEVIEPACSTQAVDATRIIPTVWLVVDGSGSMQEAISQSDSTSRWDTLRSALMDPQSGVVKELEKDVRWGLLAFDGPSPGGIDSMTPSGPATTCPRLISVDPALDNFAVLDQAYTAEPLGGSTPTDRALEALKKRLPSTGPTDAPTVVFLATDGQPNDFCSNGAAGVAADNVIAQVKQLAQSGVIVHPISLAGGDADLTRHLTDIATASGTGHAVLVPENAAELNGMIRGVFGSLASCETLLTSPIAPGAECGISVQLNGEALDCNSDNGWRLSAERDTIVLTGTACDAYHQDQSARVHAEYSCEIIQQP